MSAGPLRRIIGALGLLALVPVALLLGTGAITPEAAAVRAGVVALLVIVLGNLARVVLVGLLGRFERRRGDDDQAAEAASSAAHG